MRPLVFQPGAARAAFAILLAAWLIRELVLQARLHGGGRDPSYYAMLAGPALAVIGAFVLADEDARLPGPRWVPAVAGLALMASGMVFRNWAIQVLGRFFTVTVGVEEEHEVVDHGPYRLVRHPSYTGMLMFFAGFGIALDSWPSLAAAALPTVAAIVIRISYEERTLRRELGVPYGEYSGRTSRLIPGVW
ncbi:MAG: hypothetical protein QOD53_454 [Thermoleophilaceae bacterium]|nr:hypothetical protein [Thermoleophilaceae bacterium]